MSDLRREAPAVARNRGPIEDVLRPSLPRTGLVLEVASGTGEHCIHFARAFPALIWQPSDPDPQARQSVSAWMEAESLTNVRQPLDLDAASENWPVDSADAVLCINMIHISQWEATLGLMRGAGRILPARGMLFCYGPFRRSDHALEPSNAAFDQSLRARDPRWGLREIDDVAACAQAEGLDLEEVIEMPANNLSLIFRKR